LGDPSIKALRYGSSKKTVGHDAQLNKAIEAPFVVWHPEHVEITTNEAMAAAGGHTAKREAKEFLLERLEAGAGKSGEVIEEAKENGITKAPLKRAAKELGTKPPKAPPHAPRDPLFLLAHPHT